MSRPVGVSALPHHRLLFAALAFQVSTIGDRASPVLLISRLLNTMPQNVTPAPPLLFWKRLKTHHFNRSPLPIDSAGASSFLTIYSIVLLAYSLTSTTRVL